jgi:ubiquinone/menaquinone biosynthesis C-methylase UbiE
VDENWRELLELLVAEGRLAGGRVLEVGCGTGRLAVALAERGSRVWAVDSSEEMLREARTVAAGTRVGLRRAEAENLPFKDGWFDAAVMRLVVHLVDRPRALAELARVLVAGGRVAIATFAPEHFDEFWLTRVFPAVRELDRRRFPTPVELEAELAAAGFAEARTTRLDQTGRLARAEALERIRGRYISTLRLLDDDTFAAGLARAERELPPVVESPLRWAVVSAEIGVL